MASLLFPGFRGASGLPLRLLAGLATVAGLFFLFLKIWAEVAEGDARAVDAAILLSLRVAGHPDVLIGPTWLKQSTLVRRVLQRPAVRHLKSRLPTIFTPSSQGQSLSACERTSTKSCETAVASFTKSLAPKLLAING